MIYHSIHIDDYYAKKSSRFWPRCLALVLVGGVLFYGVYCTLRIPISERMGHFSISSQCNCEVGEKSAMSFRSAPLDTNVHSMEVDNQRLFYNRVPKCGSTTMYTLIQKLASTHGFVHFNSKVYNKKTVTEDERRRIVQWVKRAPPPCSFDRHVFFINFTRFGETPPIYINIIRDPVERIISSFFYRRMVAVNNRSTTASKVRPSSYWLHKKFEHCVMTPDPECTFIDGHNYSVLQLPYFCGQDPQCQVFNDPGALQRAKQNIEESYAVVGVLEHVNVTLRVLEAVLPQFFGGAFKMYHSLGVHRNKNLQKQRVSDEAKVVLRGNLTAEYDLYRFVLQRLYRQYHQMVLFKGDGVYESDNDVYMRDQE